MQYYHLNCLQNFSTSGGHLHGKCSGWDVGLILQTTGSFCFS